MAKTKPRMLIEFASDEDHERALDLMLDAGEGGVGIPEGIFISESAVRLLKKNGVKFKEVANAKANPVAKLLGLLAS